MNRRTFLLGLLAIPVVGPALTDVAQRIQLQPYQHEMSDWLKRGDIIASTIEARSKAIADNVCKNNLLLRRVEQDWSAMRPFKVGDEVFIGGKVLVCTNAGISSRKRLARATAFLGDYEVVNEQGAHTLVGQYLSDTTIWEHDHSRDLIRRMRATQRCRYLPSAWPFSNGA